MRRAYGFVDKHVCNSIGLTGVHAATSNRIRTTVALMQKYYISFIDLSLMSVDAPPRKGKTPYDAVIVHK